MNGHCNTCSIESQCGYRYKPTECCNYRKFKPKPEAVKVLTPAEVEALLRRGFHTVRLFPNGGKHD